ncbi:MAG: N-6 DNA methylase [Flavobacteriia bacterium]|nr:N-6 DNA methylase [Flavobacteriia bacterium]
MALFQNTVISKYLKTQNPEVLFEKWNLFTSHFHDPAIQENIRNSKEEQYQEGFLRDLFVKVLGYTLNPNPDFNLTTEYKNVKDAKKADGAVIIDDNVPAVIELKGTDTTDLGTVEDQAFGYKNNQPTCKYVIISNFEKLRFYIDNAIEHIEFNLFKLKEDEFKLLYLCLAYENIKNDIASKIKNESLSREDEITKQLYKDYSVFKRELFQNLIEENPEYNQVELFKKSQKLLDRLLFLFFGEDRGLLPPNSVRMILDQWNKLKDLDEYVPLYDRFKKYFGYLNTGFKGKQYDVFAYNGGLFEPDEILDNTKIDDNLLYTHSLKLSEYDFESEVDVNILGHIFEHSLNEIDEIKAQLEGEEIDKTKTKRKKDGVFYTPKYITKYIVENTVGKLCEEEKTNLGIKEEDYYTDKKRQLKTKQILLKKLQDYRTWLHRITIIDPACGSGSFLIEALNFLIEEHSHIDEMEAKLTDSSIAFSYHPESILEHNLYGVDINEDSVEIAKLSLWLRTAEPNRKLSSLNDNLKCGNSLIDDPEVAGDLAFNWEKEFPKVFEKGGFDVVIGNPPYGAKLSKKEKEYLKLKYSFIDSSTPNSFAYFIGLCYGLSSNLGLIVPDSFLIKDFEKTRSLLKKGISNIIWYQNTGMPESEKPFPEVEHDVVTFIFNKNKTYNTLQYSLRKFDTVIKEEKYIRDKKDICEEKYFSLFNLLIDDLTISLKNKVISNSIIKKECQIHEGIHSGNIREKLFTLEKSDLNKPMFLGGKNGDKIDNYYSNRFGWFVNYDQSLINKEKGEYASLRDESIFILPKIYITRTGNPFKCFLDEKNYASNNFFSLQLKDLEQNNKENLSFYLCIFVSFP